MNRPDLSQFPYVAVDTETTGIDWTAHRPFSAAIALPGGGDVFLNLNDPRDKEYLRNELPKAKAIVGHHLKFDMHHLLNIGVDLIGCVLHDTMIRAALLDEHRKTYDLDSLGKDLLGAGKVDIIKDLAAMFGGKATKEVQMPNLIKAPMDFIEKYNVRDARLTLQIFEKQTPLLERDELLGVYALEQALTPALFKMERAGVRVDFDRAKKAAKDLSASIRKKQKELNKLAGFNININSNAKDLPRVFSPVKRDGTWYTKDGERLGTTDGGKPGFKSEVLEDMLDPKAKLIVGIRRFGKALEMIEGHVMASSHKGRVHTTFNQTRTEHGNSSVGTTTGRLSSTDPNLQQIHKRNKELAAIIRPMFLPDARQKWCCHDWEQMDFRVFAHYVNNEKINGMYAADPMTDFHNLVAGLTGLPRNATGRAGMGNAKQMNLGLIFGMGGTTMAEKMNLPTVKKKNKYTGKEYMAPGPEAEAVFEKYHAAVPGVREFLKDASDKAQKRGYVKTIAGRRIRFPDPRFAYKAGGLIFQGTAADCLKMKLVEVDRLLQGTGGRLIINVHDEFDTSLPARKEDIPGKITEVIERFEKLRVPIRSGHGIGDDWWEASK